MTTALQPPPPSAPAARRRRSSPQSVRLALLVVALAAVWYLTGAHMVIMIAALVVIITLHETGHYLTAKWSGMKVTEFFLGFGPKIFSFQRGETEYGLKAIPAGAYVKIIGMNNLEEVDPADEPRTYRQQSYPKRLLVVLAGSGMHFLICLVLIFTLLVGWGAPGGRLFGTSDPAPGDWQVGSVLDGSAAALAGVQIGDKVISVADQPVGSFADLGAVVSPRADQTVPLVVERKGQTLALEATIKSIDEGGTSRGLLGVTGTVPREKLGVLEAIPTTAVDFGSMMRQSVAAMSHLLSPSGLSNFAGQVADGGKDDTATTGDATTPATSSADEASRPMSVVGATRFGAQALDSGVDNFLFVLLVLNAFIGLFNLIPLLPLDGGHAAIATYERIREGRSGRRYFVDVARLLPLTYAVVVGLVLLGASAMYLDVVNPANMP